MIIVSLDVESWDSLMDGIVIEVVLGKQWLMHVLTFCLYFIITFYYDVAVFSQICFYGIITMEVCVIIPIWLIPYCWMQQIYFWTCICIGWKRNSNLILANFIVFFMGWIMMLVLFLDIKIIWPYSTVGLQNDNSDNKNTQFLMSVMKYIQSNQTSPCLAAFSTGIDWLHTLHFVQSWK